MTGIKRKGVTNNMAQKMVWKRFCYGEPKGVAEDTLKWCRKQGMESKLTKGKYGYGVLVKAPSFKK